MIGIVVRAMLRRVIVEFARGRRAAAAWLERHRRPVMVQVVDEEPAEPVARRLYVSVRAGAPAVGWLRCPCGCGDVINLRLAGERRPRWYLRSTRGPATIEPSVWRKARCRSHFVLCDGRIRWC